MGNSDRPKPKRPELTPFLQLTQKDAQRVVRLCLDRKASGEDFDFLVEVLSSRRCEGTPEEHRVVAKRSLHRDPEPHDVYVANSGVFFLYRADKPFKPPNREKLTTRQRHKTN